MTTTSQPKLYFAVEHAIFVVILAALLRVGTIYLHYLEQVNHQMFGSLYLLVLPSLDLLALLAILAPSVLMLKKEYKVRIYGISILMAVMTNALLQIADRVRIDEICDGTRYDRFEGYCDLLIMQTYGNIPIVLIGLIVLLFLWPRDQPPDQEAVDK